MIVALREYYFNICFMKLSKVKLYYIYIAYLLFSIYKSQITVNIDNYCINDNDCFKFNSNSICQLNVCKCKTGYSTNIESEFGCTIC